MRFAPQRRASRAELNLTPLIDVIFNILLFFLVSTEFISEEGKEAQQQQAGVQVDLPRASSQMMLSELKDVRITVTAEGALFVDEQPVTERELAQHLSRVAETDKDTLVVLKADTGVPHGKVVRVMDLAREIGLSRLAIATDPDAQGGGAPPPSGTGSAPAENPAPPTMQSP